MVGALATFSDQATHAAAATARASRAALAATAAQNLTCPVRPLSTPGPDFHGQTLEKVSFAYQDLTNANFQGATLRSVIFVGANLSGANFSGATIGDSQQDVGFPNDFSFAEARNVPTAPVLPMSHCNTSRGMVAHQEEAYT
jgi:uncharacterized protein YjbI with pentapeptide repeats